MTLEARERRQRNYERAVRRAKGLSACGSGTPEEDKIAQSYNELSISKLLPLKKDKGLYLTGSRAWGTYHDTSDYDYICTKQVYEEYVRLIKNLKLKYVQNEYYNSIYVTGTDGMYNIICLNTFDIACWKFATRSIKGMFKTRALIKEDFYDKNKMYGIFETLKTMKRFIGDNTVKDVFEDFLSDDEIPY